MRVGGSDVGAAVGRAADDDRAIDQPAGHVAHVGGVVEDLVERDRVKRPEHQFHHRANTEHGRTDTGADETGFTDGGVDDAFGAEFFEQAFRDLVGPVKLGDLFAHEDDVFVAG